MQVYMGNSRRGKSIGSIIANHNAPKGGSYTKEIAQHLHKLQRQEFKGIISASVGEMNTTDAEIEFDRETEYWNYMSKYNLSESTERKIRSPFDDDYEYIFLDVDYWDNHL